MTGEGCSEYIRDNLDDILMRMLDEYRTNIWNKSSTDMSELSENQVDLIVTSPPYPMVEQWDDFGSYEEQHNMIHSVIEECWKVLREGGLMCINIGNATRSVDGQFKYFPNTAMIYNFAWREQNFTPLVPIHWIKPTNKPNAFLGSGFHPPNAYVTQDAEYILIFRKGDTRSLPDDRVLWNASQFKREERDKWFCQQWTDVPGEDQDGTAQFPIEIPYRLIRMFSIIGDTVLDPFAGTGTTVQMARALGRRGIGYEINEDLVPRYEDKLDRVSNISNRDILSNLVMNEESDKVGSEVFIRNPNSLIDNL